MHSQLVDLLGSYGYVLLALLVGLEGLGIPLPGEMALVTSAALAARGHLSITGVVITTIVAAIAGDNGGYWIGRKGGLAAIQRFGKYLRIGDSHLAKAHAYFDRHGSKTVFFARFFALLRIFAAVLAGAAEMPYRTFVLWNAAGVICWASTFAALGYGFGRQLPRLERFVGRVTLATVLLIALVAGLFFWWRWFSKNRARIAERSEQRWLRALSAPWLARFGTRHPHVRELLSARFVHAEYLGAHLTIGFVISLLGLWLFAAITEAVVEPESLTAFDHALLRWVRSHPTSTGLDVASTLSFIASPPVIATIAVAVAIALGWRRRWTHVAGWVAALTGGGLLIALLKLLVRRRHPAYAAAFTDTGILSFPSSHAMGALICYGMLAYLALALGSARTITRVAVVVAAVVLVIAIGLSRMYLGVHYFSDIVGGYATGVLWLAACVSGVEIARGTDRSPTTGDRSETGN